MKLVSMEQEKEKMGGYPEEYSEPKYPYGLEIHLGDDQLKALGINDVPQVGAEMLLSCMVKVTSVRLEEKQDDETDACCSMQITAIGTNGLKKGMFDNPSRKKEED